MSAVSAGIVFSFCGVKAAVPKGVTVNGAEVGGMQLNAAKAKIRNLMTEELKGKSLTVEGRNADYVFTYPEINFKDDLQKLLSSAKKGGRYTASCQFYVNGLDEVVSYISSGENVELIQPYAEFNAYGEPFVYHAGVNGVTVDGEKLKSDILSSLGGGFEKIKLSYFGQECKSLDEVKLATVYLGGFTTYFDGGNAERSHNIRLASDFINGTVLKAGEEFSFNRTVGERTAARGFKSAKIIERGEFVQGIGGGVCQVSTTLFNAALLSGCRISEFHPHSLAVSYVPPSFDAMVSGNYYDLKFVNVSGSDLYIRAETGNGFVRFKFYGKSDGTKYEYNYTVRKNIPAPEEETDDVSKVRNGKDGVISEGYLSEIKDGRRKTVLLRRDKYAPLKGYVAKTADSESGAD